MRTMIFSGLVACATAAGLLTACSGDDTSVGDAGADGGGTDAAARDAAPGDAGSPGDAGDTRDAAVDAGGDAASARRSYLVLTYGDGPTSTFAAFDKGDLSTAGTFQYSGFGSQANGATSMWTLEQASDVIHKMDAVQPWKVASTWSVAVAPAKDGGLAYADPWSVAEGGGKAYVSLFNRNVVAVTDVTKASDGGAPTKLIDVSRWVQPQDGDGFVDMTDLVYVPSQNRVYVLLGNIDLGKTSGAYQICDGAKSAVGAIDVATDTIVDLGSAAVGSGTLPLKGVSPVALTYDAKNDRLLVVNGGCNEPGAGGDAGPGPLRGRGIEEVKIAAKTTRVLLDANAQDFPGKLVYVDETHAFMTFYSGVTYAWDPTSPTLGPAIASAPDAFDYDGKGALVGPKTKYLADGGVDSVDLISVRTDDGGVTVLRKDALPKSSYVEAISTWPSR